MAVRCTPRWTVWGSKGVGRGWSIVAWIRFHGRIYRKVFVDLVAPAELALPKMYEDRMVARGYVVRSELLVMGWSHGDWWFLYDFWNTFRFSHIEIFFSNIVVIFGDSSFKESLYDLEYLYVKFQYTFCIQTAVAFWQVAPARDDLPEKDLPPRSLT